MSGKREFGDYQTPIEFSDKVCSYLYNVRKLSPDVVIEPTCGIGNFIKSSLIFRAKKYYGIEINSKYCEKCKDIILDENVSIINADLFTFNIGRLADTSSNILIIGNPPWVNNSTLSTLRAKNIPFKSNFKGLTGIDALTGASNFDICEYMILRLISEFCHSDTIIAMLCKTSVARSVFKEVKRKNIGFEFFDLLEFNAADVFGISASTCLMIIKLSAEITSPEFCNVYSFESYDKIKYSFGYINGELYSNLQSTSFDFNGQCCFEWRQGVKHDCSKVMELTLANGSLYNGKKDLMDIEKTYLFPLVKSSMFKYPIINSFTKYVLVTQKKARDETHHIKNDAPKTWKYLNENKEDFEKRRSSIYQGAPVFSMFGVGDYSYSRYKVGISGFYKKPLFSLLYSYDEKAVMTDDTAYFICFDNYDMAYTAMIILNSNPVQEFIMSVAFLDSKRPYTKKVLERICFKKIVDALSYDDLQKTERKLNLNPYVNANMYQAFKELVYANRKDETKNKAIADNESQLYLF